MTFGVDKIKINLKAKSTSQCYHILLIKKKIDNMYNELSLNNTAGKYTTRDFNIAVSEKLETSQRDAYY